MMDELSEWEASVLNLYKFRNQVLIKKVRWLENLAGSAQVLCGEALDFWYFLCQDKKYKADE